MAESAGEITRLLMELRKGNRAAESQLVPLVYGELRGLAARYMRQERPDHTLQPTALVHEAYLRLMEQRQIDWQSRAHFYAVAAQLMRRILVDHARARRAGKRGGSHHKVSLEEAADIRHHQSVDLIGLDDALERLARWDTRQSRIVELRFFGGLSIEETAEVLGVSTRTVKREWTVARAWLYGELRGSGRDVTAMGTN